MIQSRIQSRGLEWVFTPNDFLDLGSRTAVGLALMRHLRAKSIRKLSRGLYDYPRSDPSLGLLPPSTDAIAQALKGRDDFRIQVSGAHAAHQLGLCEQVPVRTVYLTDGRARKVQIGKRQIIFKRASTRQLATAGEISGTVIQALRWLGRPHIGSEVVEALRKRLSAEDKQRLQKDIRYAPAWIAEIIRKIAAN